MIVCRLKGGLGNQMFQYATARGLSVHWNVPLRIDHTGFRHDRVFHRTYELGNFSISTPVATPDELRRPGAWSRAQSFALRNLEAIWRDYIGSNYCPYVRYWPFREYLRLDSYWQSERYFRHIRPTLTSEFSSNRPLSESDRRTAVAILNANSVAVHFRRIGSPVVCPPDYYRNAVRIIRDHVSSPEFFLFSDDLQGPGWPQQEHHPWTMVRSADDNPALAEFELMRLCKHHVIANSTFGWWAAWLAGHVGHVVVAPKFGWSTLKKRVVKDALPAEWIGLD